MVPDIVKVIVPAVLVFLVGIALTPFITHLLYSRALWKKTPGKARAYGGGEAEHFNRLHKGKDTGTPRMGGLVVWISLTLVAGLLLFLSYATANPAFDALNFLSRSQTIIPLALLLGGAIVGLVDDLLVVQGRGGHAAGGLSLGVRLSFVSAAAFFSGWWFFEKLETSTIQLPVLGLVDFGVAYLGVFLLVTLAVYASGVIDGLDGLAGGVFALIFSAYAAIAYFQGQVDLAALCAASIGGLMAFLWFNIPPARFYMGETGMMGLTLMLSAVAFLTDRTGSGMGVAVLPVIGLLLVATVASVVLQIIAKRFFGRKIFLSAPLHHHFEAIGWPAYKVTMRYWVIGAVCAFSGVVIALIG